MSEQPRVKSLDLDQISLEQALRDFEVANARVVDLTQRVISLTRQLRDTQDEVERLRIEARSARAEAEAIKRSRAYNIARHLGDLRSILR
jgi:predicted  nucleic acid-binding Zn-ribbon protein